jgi:serine/threonine protein kinase
MTAGSIPTNQRVAGRYEVLGEIARGRMARVYRVVDQELGREAALKVLDGTYAADPEAIRRFVDEVRITAQLQHPGIPPVFDIGKLPDGRPFMTLQLIKGRALDDLLLREDLTAERGRFLAVFEQVCQVYKQGTADQGSLKSGFSCP